MGITLKSALEYLKDFDTYSPYQEAITKVSDWIELFQANYNKRLREDMAAMLTELQLKIEEEAWKQGCASNNDKEDEAYKIYYLIQDKINELRGKEDE